MKITLDLPDPFNADLDQKLSEFAQSGITKTKEQYIIELAQRTLLHDKCCDEIIEKS